jgi:hypothetical protein
MSHRIKVMISWEELDEPIVEFTCHGPEDAWCRRNAVAPAEPPPEDPTQCYYTTFVSGLTPWGETGTYDGPLTELRSGRSSSSATTSPLATSHRGTTSPPGTTSVMRRSTPED